MNVYLAKFMMYYEIQRMSREGLSVSQISNYLGLNRRTVTRYLSLDEKQYENFLIQQSERKKALDAYEGFIKDRLERYRDTSAAQMHDWLKEFDPNFPAVNPKTIFNFVFHIRKKYNLPRIKIERQFEMVEELPYGQQAQVDFGEYNMRTVTGSRVKVFFFALVLSRSRYKYLWFTDNYFTAEWAILAHEKAFEYIGGIPDVVVYDQDTILIINENYGDIILTKSFRNYMREQSFQLHFCRRSDPQSKGKVENVIKYVKQNFLYNRTFHNTETLNDEALAWLGRTANALPHSFTRKEPCKEWHIEQPFLKPYRCYPVKIIPMAAYTVRKDNAISYKGNLYSLPKGTYQGKETHVALRIEQGYLIITDLQDNHEIGRHLIASGRGKKIINTDHRRDKTAAIDEMIDHVVTLFPQAEKARQWLSAIRKHKPRYIRDQILVIRQSVQKATPQKVDQALNYCLENHIHNATDFKAVLDHFDHEQASEKETKIIPLNLLNTTIPKEAFNQPSTSSIEDYQEFIKNKQHGDQE
jgi:transposase